MRNLQQDSTRPARLLEESLASDFIFVFLSHNCEFKNLSFAPGPWGQEEHGLNSLWRNSGVPLTSDMVQGGAASLLIPGGYVASRVVVATALPL